MKIELNSAAQFKADGAKPASAEDLLLPDVEAVVRHLARIAARADYSALLREQGSRYHSADESEAS